MTGNGPIHFDLVVAELLTADKNSPQLLATVRPDNIRTDGRQQVNILRRLRRGAGHNGAQVYAASPVSHRFPIARSSSSIPSSAQGEGSASFLQTPTRPAWLNFSERQIAFLDGVSGITRSRWPPPRGYRHHREHAHLRSAPRQPTRRTRRRASRPGAGSA